MKRLGSDKPTLAPRSVLASRAAAANPWGSRSMTGATRAAARSGETASALCTAPERTPAPADEDGQAGNDDQEHGAGGGREAGVDLERLARRLEVQGLAELGRPLRPAAGS